jgi:uncharacterized SAM-binding protein YcdF (DUF218 family)
MTDAGQSGEPETSDPAAPGPPAGEPGRRSPERIAKRRRRRRWIGIIALIIVLLFAAITARVFVWPDLPALPQHADAIVELAGPGDAGRDALALKLARAHRADYLVQSTTVGDTHCLPPPAGVQLLCFHPDPGTTRGEAQWIGREAKARNWKSVILVTTPDQAYRAKLRVDRCFPGKVYVATSTLPWQRWFTQIPYQWGATVKALTVQRSC